MKKPLIKIGAYLILISGIIVSSLILIFAIALLINFPEASMSKKITVIAGLLIAAIAVFALALSIFESMHELLVMEDEINKILTGKKTNG